MQQFNNNDIQELKDIIRIGTISNVNAENRTARVHIKEQGIITGELKIVQNMPKIKIIKEDDTLSDCKVEIKQWTPEIGEWVLCLFNPDGEGDGFILGGV